MEGGGAGPAGEEELASIGSGRMRQQMMKEPRRTSGRDLHSASAQASRGLRRAPARGDSSALSRGRGGGAAAPG